MKNKPINYQEIVLATDHDALLDLPYHPNLHQPKNKRCWAATVERNPNYPGGLKREFIEHSTSSDYYYSIHVSSGQVIEFAFDESARIKKRIYGLVTFRNENEIVLWVPRTYHQAFELQRRWIEELENIFNRMDNDENENPTMDYSEVIKQLESEEKYEECAELLKKINQ